MRRLLFFLLFLLSAPIATAKTDTELHIEYTAAISSGSGFFCQRLLNFNKIESFACGVGAGMLAGVGKEVMDSREPHNNFSGHDIRNDLIGSFLGAMAYRMADDIILTPIFNPKNHFYGVNFKMEM